jgi:type II secretory pathway component PulM
MKKFFEQLRPAERRLVIGVGVVLLVVLNWVLVWPHFSDWGNASRRYENARQELKSKQAKLALKAEFEKQMKDYASEGEFVAPEDQAVNFMRTVQSTAATCGFGIENFSRSQMRTNQFFVEQVQNITVHATEDQLVDFLYKLGSGASMIRVRDLTLSPDQARQKLGADIRLVASYQKNPKPASAATETKPATAKAK